MRINPKLKIRKIAGSAVVIVNGDMTRMLSLNATSEWLWGELQGREFELWDVVALLTSHYEVAEDVAAEDARKWIKSMEDGGALG